MTQEQKIEAIAHHIEQILTLLGEDVTRPGLIKTPVRAAKALSFITSGYNADAAQTLSEALFEHEGSQMVMVRNIEFYSMCEHHILPFFGTVDIAYIPDGKIVGLSKIARIVNIFARRLQIQERFTSQLADILMETLGAKGVMIRCTAQHLCMKMRGVEKQDALTVTTHAVGVFAGNAEAQQQFYNALS